MKRIIIFFLLILFLAVPVIGQSPQDIYTIPTPSIQEIQSYFRNVSTIPRQNITIPTVIELPITKTNQSDFFLIENESNSIQPFRIVTSEVNPVTSIVNETGTNLTSLLTDDNSQTYIELPLNQTQIQANKPTESTLTFNFSRSISTASLSFELAQNTELPTYMSIKSLNDNKVIIDRQRIYQNRMYYPTNYGTAFEVTFYYEQPLRINKIQFDEINPEETAGLRFLARPNNSYTLYSTAEGNVPYYTVPDSGNLLDSTIKPIRIKTTLSANPQYRPADDDRDGIVNADDNCPQVANKDQTDVDANMKGDACEDFDFDGLMNDKDNCRDIANPRQQDEDGDGKGDHCDGEESRFIEQISYLPWVGIAAGFIIVIFLFKFTIEKKTPPIDDPLS